MKGVTLTITEKVAYLKGLADGVELDAGTKEAKIFKAIFDVLEDMALTVTDLDESLDLVTEQLDAVDEDLDDLETYVYEELGECDCDECGEWDDFDDDEMFEKECPACHKPFFLDEYMLDEDFIECPNCGEKLELSVDYDCDCGCEDDDKD